MPTSSKTTPLLVAMALIAVVMVEAQPSQDCASKLTPCSQFLNSTNPPKECCDSLKDAITNERPCLCNLYGSGFLNSIGINLTESLQLPQRCGIANAGDLSACGNTTSGTPPTNTPSPVTRPPPSASTAKYILQQYSAAIGGPPAMSAVSSICAIGQIKFSTSEFYQGDKSVKFRNTDSGGFVIWQKNPHSWCMEMLVAGCKVISGCDGKVSWRQSSNQQIPVAKGPPRPLRRFLQGLDPRAIAYLFVEAVCIGEQIIKDEDCFILKLDTNQSILEEQSCPKYEIIHHTIWGYFSQRSGLLVKFEDSRLISVKTNRDDGEGVFWETSTESVIDGYKYVDGVNVAHSGRTTVTIFRYGEQSANHKRELQENWNIEEVHFNIKGLKQEFFMPPTDFKK